MSARLAIAPALATLLLVAGCGDDDDIQLGDAAVDASRTDASIDTSTDAGGDGGLRLSPASAALKVGGSARYRALDGQGNPTSASFAVIGAGSIDAAGHYRAPAQPAIDTIRATAGGLSADASAVVSAYLGRLQLLAPATPRSAHTATLLDDGSVLLAGGIPNSGVLHRYLPELGDYQVAGDLGGPRWQHSATRLPGDAVLLAGGRTNLALATAVTYQAGTVQATATPLIEARFAHGAVELASGETLLTGGLPRPGSEVPALASAELYDPATRRFRSAGVMAARRSGHTLTRLRDGRVLVVGGRDSTCFDTCPQVYWSSAELYDPGTGQFSPTGAMALARADHTATLLPDGRVLIAGGTTPDLPSTDLASQVELYDPATGRFSSGGTMLRPRAEHTATLLGDGRILLAHGRSEGDGTLATPTLEVFTPGSGASTLLTSQRTTRYRHTATLLEAGQVLLLGGTEGGGGIVTVELFD